MPGEFAAWVEPDGTVHPLSGNPDVNVLVGREGAYGPVTRLIEDAVPLQAGTRLRGVRVQPRDLNLPLLVQASAEATLRVRLREVARWFDATRGDGRLRVVGPDGSMRELVCRSPEGLQVRENSDSYFVTAAVAVVPLRAPDPYWQATAPTTQTIAVAAPPAFFPFFPMSIAASSVSAAQAVTNPGDVDAYPVWTITGPSTTVVVRNDTTGEQTSLPIPLGAGEVVVIDTRPGRRTVTRGAESLLGDLTTDSWLWWLRPGANAVAIEMGDVTVGSSVALSFVPRYRTV